MEGRVATSDEPPNSVPEAPLDSTNQAATQAAIWLWKLARQVVVFVVGSTVLLIGILMIVAPGPAVVFIPVGLAILATEFTWARKWLAYAKRHLAYLRTHLPTSSHSKMNSSKPIKCRTEIAAGYPQRQSVDEAHADWDQSFDGYNPPEYTAKTVFQNEGKWADPADVHSVPREFFTLTPDGDRPVARDAQGYPLNPLGRTGLRGRGLLGKWGRNRAGDPLVIRIDPKTGHHQVLVIERRDSGRTALPGGMVDEGEVIATTVSRELFEETGLKLNFDDAVTIYAGVVDDPRNTDNAWMETTVLFKRLKPADRATASLKAGDDAKAVRWMDINESLLASMYASHGEFVRLAIKQIETEHSAG